MNMRYTQISGFMPYTQLNTIDLCTFTFITDDKECRKQVNSKQDHRAFILEFKVQSSCILSQFQELGARGLDRASASSILREGDWSHVGDLIGGKGPAIKEKGTFFWKFLKKFLPFKNKNYSTLDNLQKYGHITLKFVGRYF